MKYIIVLVRKCLFEYTDGEALRIYGDSNIVENCYMQYIDYSVSELPFLMVGVYFNGDANKFLHNTVHDAAASAFLAPGTTPEFAYIMMFGLLVPFNLMDLFIKGLPLLYRTLTYTITIFMTLQNML